MSDYWKKKLDEVKKTNASSTKSTSTKSSSSSSSDYWKKKLEEVEGANKKKKKKKTTTDIAPVKEDKGLDFFQKGVFDDGYDFGDVTKSILGTAGDLGLGVFKGASKLVEGVVDAGSYGVAAVADNMGYEDFSDRLRVKARENTIDKAFAPEDKFLNQYSLLGRTSDAVAEGLGQVGAVILTGGVAGALGAGAVGATAATTGVMGISSFGAGVSEAYEGGATDEEAATYGLIKGVVDAGSELIFGGLGKTVKALGVSKGLSSLDDVFAQKLASKITSQTAKNFVEYGVKASAEGVEEVLAGIGSAVGKQLTYMEEKELRELIEDEDLFEQFIVGAVTSGVAQSGIVPGMKGGSLREANQTGRDFISGMSENEQKVVEKEFENRVAAQEKNGEKLSEQEKSKIYDAVVSDMEKGYISTDTIEEVLGGDTFKSYRETVDSEDAIAKEFEELGKKQNATLAEQSRYNDLKQQMDEIKQNSQRNTLKSQLSEDVMGLVQNDRLAESYNERARRGQAYEADLTKYNEKQQAVIQKAVDSGILNNTRRTHEFVDMIAKISADKGVLFDFTNNEKLKGTSFAVDGKTVNGFVKDGNVTLNIDSAKSLNSVVGHEITHVLEGTELYAELQTAVMEYAKTKSDYRDRVNSVKELYKDIEGADYASEMTADLIGDYLFTDHDFINNLSTNHRNVFQKIYDEIKYLCKVATAGSKEARELEKVKRAFEKAYNADSKAEIDTKYSVSDSSGKQLTKEQQEYFKDSKMRNDNGDLMVMYHGSQDAGFHVFDASMSDDNTSFFFVDRNDVAASYSGTSETYEAKTIRTAEDMNNFLAEIGQDEDYSVIEKDGKFELLYDGDRVAQSDTAPGIYKEFCWYEGVGEGDANYKVYLNLKNPLVVDAQGRNWDRVGKEFSRAIYDKYHTLTVEEKAAMKQLAAWEDFRIFRDEWEYAGLWMPGIEKALISAYGKLSDADVYDVFSIVSDDFSEESIREYARRWTNTRHHAKIAKDQGYDGVIFKNIVDVGGYGNGDEGAATVAIAFESNQIKSVANDKPTADKDIRYSLSSIANTFFGDENMSANDFAKVDYKQTQGYKDYVDQCLSNYKQSRKDFDEGVARKEIEDSIDGIVRVAIAAKKAGYDIYDDKTKRSKKDSKKRLLFSSLEPNSEYFTSNDISTICDKRKNFADIYDDIVRAEEAKGVSADKRFFSNVDNYFYLHKLMADKGLTQPCRQCYVESMRKNLAPMANAFLRLVQETNPDNTANDQLFEQKGKNKGKQKVNNTALREWVLTTLGEYDMSVGDLTVETLTTEDGLAELKIRAPMIYEAFNSFYGQSKPKMPKSATPFRFGELTALLTDEKGRIKQSVVDKINSTGGFRLQSYSDFQIQNFTDVLQVIFEAGTLGLNGHAYTKVPAFLDATEGTNLKRNISIFMYKDGNEWKLDRNDSFPYTLDEIYDIVRADKSGNTGIIAVSQNEDMSAWIMANDMVGYGIPFHKSGLKMGVVRDTVVMEDGREIKGYTGTKDHTKQQTEVWAKASEDHKALTKVKKGINIYRFWDFDNKSNLSKNDLIEKNVKAYIDACEMAGYLPKFREYVMNNGKVLNNVLEYSKKLGYASQDATIEDISFEYKGYRIPYGYYKFLGDFGMFTPDGKASSHEVLSLNNYDFDKAVEFFANSEELHRNEILQQFANGEERQRYRDSNLTAEELQEIVKQKRSEIAESVASYSVSGKDRRAYGTYNVYGKDIALAPVVSAENAITTEPATRFSVDEMFPDDLAPAEYDPEQFDSLDDADAPPEMEAPYYGEETVENVEVEDPFEERDWDEVGSKKVKAYMYENPEVKPFFQAEAKVMLGELRDTTKGERWYNDKLYYDSGGEEGFGGTKRHTSADIAYLLDEGGFTYAEIEKGLKAIIEDNGAENIAAAKRIEFILNDRLLNGYQDFWIDHVNPPDQDYIKLLNEKQITEYSQEAFDLFMEEADKYAPPISEEIAPTFTDSVRSSQVRGQQEIPRKPGQRTIGTDNVAPSVENKNGQGAMYDVPEKVTRKSLHEGILDNIKSTFKAKGFDFDTVLRKAKNLSTFSTVDNTPQRVMEKALGYKEGQVLADETVNKVAQNETAGIVWLNEQIAKIKAFSKQYNIKPGSKESAAAQMYAEGFYVDEENNIIEYGDAELAIDFPDARTRANIKGLAKDGRIRQIYDETLAAINESRTRNAYPAIPRLDNYFLHFRAMEDTFSRLGLPFNPNDIRAKDLPTDLNGVTADLKPGQPYFASAMHRTGKRTSFDLLGGLERYLSSAKNQIYHIDDIQTLRALRNYIADTYGQAHGLENLDSMSEEEAQERIKEVYGAHLSTFAKFLNEEANVLAGKTALIDRGLEGIIGRRGMTFLDTVNKQVGSNMVGFNVSSSLTNFLPVVQTIAKGNKAAFVKAFAQTVAHKVSGRSDGFAENSPVMIRRKGADRFYRTPWQKAGDAGYVLMGAVDSISTELIARTKYNELVKNGMDSQKAHYETDKWVSRLMGDRSLGQMPQLYNSKMLGLLTKFQLEVRNQLDSQFYDTIQEAKVSNEHIQNEQARNAKTAAKVASTFFQLAVAQHLFGTAFESVAGYNPAFDIIEVLMTAFGFDDDEESEDTTGDNIEQGFLALLEDLPYASTFLDGGRIPISSALPIAELVKGEDEWGNEKSRWETLGEIAPYYALPTGYGQIKKTYAGLNMFSDEHPVAGSYTDSGNLRFPVEDTIGNRVKAGIFGQYANENARNYFDNERNALKEKQIQEFADVGMDIEDYWAYRDGLNKQETLEDKFNYIAGLDLSVEQKNILINNIVDRKEDVDMVNYDDFASYEEFDFYSKNKEKYNFLQDHGVSYAEYKSSEDAKDQYDSDYSWYKNNPEKVTVSKAVTDNVLEYRTYTRALNDIRADKDENGDSIRGSAKDKKADYINGLDIDYGAKLILFKSEYKADDTYNMEIVEYLNSRQDISYEDMVTILEELDFIVSGDSVTW